MGYLVGHALFRSVGLFHHSGHRSDAAYRGITDINSAADAAKTLRPLAGPFAFTLFAIGMLGVGFIGVPVLAGSGAYAAAELMGWNQGLESGVSKARGFYGVIAVSVLLGLILQYSPLSPMKALFWSAVLNGVVAVPLVVVVVLLASKNGDGRVYRRTHDTRAGLDNGCLDGSG